MLPSRFPHNTTRSSATRKLLSFNTLLLVMGINLRLLHPFSFFFSRVPSRLFLSLIMLNLPEPRSIQIIISRASAKRTAATPKRPRGPLRRQRRLVTLPRCQQLAPSLLVWRLHGVRTSSRLRGRGASVLSCRGPSLLGIVAFVVCALTGDTFAEARHNFVILCHAE